MPGESGLLFQIPPVWQVLLSCISFILGSCWETASFLSSSNTTGVAADRLHPGGRFRCICVFCVYCLSVPMEEAELIWWARNSLLMSWVNCPGRLQRLTAHRFSAVALGVSKGCRNPSWKYKPLGFFWRLLQDFLRTWECPTGLWKAKHYVLGLGLAKPQLPA